MSDGSEITEPDLALPSTAEPHTMDARSIDTDAAMGNLDGYLEAIERDIITEALERTRWNRTSAAKLLGISFRQMRYRLQKLGLE